MLKTKSAILVNLSEQEIICKSVQLSKHQFYACFEILFSFFFFNLHAHVCVCSFVFLASSLNCFLLPSQHFVLFWFVIIESHDVKSLRVTSVQLMFTQKIAVQYAIIIVRKSSFFFLGFIESVRKSRFALSFSILSFFYRKCHHRSYSKSSEFSAKSMKYVNTMYMTHYNYSFIIQLHLLARQLNTPQ